MHKYLVIACLAFLFSGCDDDVKGPTQLRVKNSSIYNFDQITVISPGGEEQYGNLAPLQYSDYREFEYIYSYSYIKVTIGTKDYVLQPIDYVGEERYTNGRYTYIISLDDPDSDYGLSLGFRED